MNLDGNMDLASGYRNPSQQARRVSEDWIARNGYCLRCDSDRLHPTTANTRTRDFVCQQCRHGYELKSKRGVFSKTILDGAYDAMLRTIRSGKTPTFLLMEYSTSWSILRLRAIHHSLITEAAIKPRAPLSPFARRAGWVGCNIMLPEIALQGQISLLEGGALNPRPQSRQAFASLEALSNLSSERRSWAATILRLTDRLNPAGFTLSEMYAFEPELHSIFSQNRNIRPKIRQQLQVLRDAGLVKFRGGGHYERTGNG